MKMTKISHKSVVDWDYSPGFTRALDATYFISPPSSLRLTYPPSAPADGTILCRIAETLAIAEGEVRTWYRTNDRVRAFYLFFRNQAPLGSASWANTYSWSITGDWIYLYKRIADVPVLLGTFAVSWTIDIWYHWRTVYWNGATPAGIPALAVQLFLEIAGEWVQQGATVYDTQNEWKDSEINRSGIGADLTTIYTKWFDDTEIWAAV